MKIRIPALTIELSDEAVEALCETFGIERDYIRQDVRSYLQYQIPELGAFGNGEVEATFHFKGWD